MSTRRLAIGTGLVLLGALAVAATRAEEEVPESLLVFTQVAVPEEAAAPSGRFPAASRVAAVDLADAGADVRVLTPDFVAARAPDVHFDGRRVVFAGQREADGPWQIWELDLADPEPRLLTPFCQRCTDPIYRADDGIVFTAPVDSAGPDALFTLGPGETAPRRITFHPLSDAAPALVSDGRIVVATGAPSDAAPTAFYALRHDGTGAELMYRAEEGAGLAGRVHERADRELVFVEQPIEGEPRVVTVSQAYPATSRREVAVPAGARVHSVGPAPGDALIASLRQGGDPTFTLWRLPGGAAPEPLVGSADYHAVEPVLARPHPRPLGFVSATDPAAETGIVYGLNARLTGLGTIDSTATSLRVRTPNGELGVVPLAEDGSFHLELPANTPLQLETLDAAGRVVDGPSAWMWVRPGELSGCVGCHEDRGLTPDNRVPMAAIRPAVSLVPGQGSESERGSP